MFGSYGNKSKVIRKELLSRLKQSRLSIVALSSYITRENIAELILPGNIVLLCVDNHATRKLVSDHCATIKNIVLISGGNDGVGKAPPAGPPGFVRQCPGLCAQGRERRTPSLTKLHPEIEHPKDKPPHELNCTELVVSQPQILFSNLAVASAMLNTLLLVLSRQLHYGELSFDIAEGLMRPTIKVNL